MNADRLERLLVLIEEGPAAAIRERAAAELARLGCDTTLVLDRLRPLLAHSEWAVRSAAADAVYAVANTIPPWRPMPTRAAAGFASSSSSASSGGASSASANTAADAAISEGEHEGGRLCFTADAAGRVRRVLERGQPLLASGGSEFDPPAGIVSMAVWVALQQKHIRKRIGLLDDPKTKALPHFIAEKDVMPSKRKVAPKPAAKKRTGKGKAVPADGLSVRERALAKRRAKVIARANSKVGHKVRLSSMPVAAAAPAAPVSSSTASASSSSSPPSSLNAPSSAPARAGGASAGASNAATVDVASDPRTPALSVFANELAFDLFDANWGVRHGAALALTALLRAHSWSMGVQLRMNGGSSSTGGCSGGGGDGEEGAELAAHEARLNASFLEDLSFRAVCVAALDRFGDFGGGTKEMVAPNREAAAHLLGVAAQSLGGAVRRRAAVALLELSAVQSDWEVRHGALLGLQVLLSVDSCEGGAAMLAAVLPALVPRVMHMLRADTYDDVRAAAAAALVPVADRLGGAAGALVAEQGDISVEGGGDITGALWCCLVELDALSFHACSVMQLLHALYEQSEAADVSPQHIASAMNMLNSGVYPVRTSAVMLLRVLVLRQRDPSAGTSWVEACCAPLLRHTFWHLLAEHCRTTEQETANSLVPELQQLWSCLVARIPPKCQSDGTCLETLQELLRLATAPEGALLREIAVKQVYASAAWDWFPCADRDLAVVQSSVAREGLRVYDAQGGRASLSMRVVAARAMGRFLGAAWPITVERDEALPAYRCLGMGESLRAAPAQRAVVCLLALAHCAEMVDEARAGGEAAPFHEALGSWLRREHSDLRQAGGAPGANEGGVLGGAARVQLSLSVALAATGLHDTPMCGAITDDLFTALPDSVLQGFAACCLARLTLREPDVAGDVAALREHILMRLLPMNCPETDDGGGDNAVAADGRGGEGGAFSLLGAGAALSSIALSHGNALFTNFPTLWHMCGSTAQAPKRSGPGSGAAAGKSAASAAAQAAAAEESVELLQVQILTAWSIASMLPAMRADLHPLVASLVPGLAALLGVHESHTTAVGMFAACLCGVSPEQGISAVITHIVPLLQNMGDDAIRAAAAAVLCKVVQSIGDQDAIIPFTAALLLPCVAAMNDPCIETREPGAECFVRLARLVTLDKGAVEGGAVTEPQGSAVAHAVAEGRDFVATLLRGEKLPHYEMSLTSTAKTAIKLRAYQQSGLNWLGFLCRFGLHGILCDEMGLGKTLQTLAIVSSELTEQRARYEGDATAAAAAVLPSLIVCPSSLVEHWAYECYKFFGDGITTLCYRGNRAERGTLLKSMRSSKIDLLVVSFAALRQDAYALREHVPEWSFIVLDEGHLIKNQDTLIAKCVKELRGRHRLILTGTPIANNVLEMWSLFDFLLPGLLGSKKDFQASYGRHVNAYKDAKATRKQKAAAALALEQLHERVLPFLLRRTKREVLTELPDKIIQDYFCQLSPAQARCYNALAEQGGGEAEAGGGEVASGAGCSKRPSCGKHLVSIGRMLQACQHPSLVADAVGAEVSAHQSDDLASSGKLSALLELLHTCNIGENGHGAADRHRCLIFAQHVGVLDLIESLVLGPALPAVRFLRLDGSVRTQKRLDIVNQFNGDASIELMLLTTRVGGHGLNLTGADVVIFVEHDWNPMNDMQAMDRAHRLGQMRVVQVFRLITKDTIEERVMSLQKMKLKIASTVISGAGGKGADGAKTSSQILDVLEQAPGAKQRVTTGSAVPAAPTDCLNEFGQIGAVNGAVGSTGAKQKRRVDGGRADGALAPEEASGLDDFLARDATKRARST